MKVLAVEYKEKMKIFIQMSKNQVYSIFYGRTEVKLKLGKQCTGLWPFTSQKRVSSMLIDYILC